MKNVLHAAIILFVVVVLGVVGQAATAPAADMLMSTNQLAANLTDRGLVILHVGMDRSVYDAGHITGARYVAWKDITVTRNGVPNQLPPTDALAATLEKVGVGDNSRVIIYGDTPLLATYVYFALDVLGHSNHSVLDGGLVKWKAEKRPVDTVVPAFSAAKLTPKPHPELVADLPAVQKMVAENKIPRIDGRPADQFAGTTPGDDIKRAGHIPGAKNVFWMQTVVSKEDPVLKPSAYISALYEAAGAKPGERVLSYCRTGLIATHVYFTLKLAGFHPVVYSGSYMEWSNAPATPIATGAGL